LPAWLGRVQAGRRAPHLAIVALFAVMAPLAIMGIIGRPVSATVLLLLTVFAFMNGALVILKRRRGERPGRFEIPLAVPVLGALVCPMPVIVRVVTGEWHASALAGGLLAGIVAIHFLLRPKRAAMQPS
jgi:amino acid transporter